MLKITGTTSWKKYKCTHCGNISSESTNHYGEIYSKCTKCSWKRPMDATIKVCEEPLPEGWDKPEPWKVTKIGEIC